MGKSNFSEQFRKLINRHKWIKYNPYIMRRLHAKLLTQLRLVAMFHSLIARRWVGLQTQWRSRHKAFTSGFGFDAMSLAWPTVVQLVVSFNSGLHLEISQEYTFLFCHSDRFDLMFSLRCIDWVRKPLCEPNFLCFFFFLYKEFYSRPRVKFIQWKAFEPLPHPPSPTPAPVVYTIDRSKTEIPMLFLFYVAL